MGNPNPLGAPKLNALACGAAIGLEPEPEGGGAAGSPLILQCFLHSGQVDFCFSHSFIEWLVNTRPHVVTQAFLLEMSSKEMLHSCLCLIASVMIMGAT